MFIRASILCAATSLLSMASALPTTELHTLNLRDDSQCPVGSAYYVCNINNFRGCCSIDPCAIKEGCPDAEESPKPPTDGTCVDGTRLFQPKMQFISSDIPEVSTPDFNLTRTADKEWQQLMTFSNIPKAAKSCRIMWAIPEERNFKAGNTAQVRVFDAASDVSLGSPDFSFWPDTAGPHDALAATTDCKEELSFRLAMDHEDYVFLEQNSETGWFIEYSC